MLCCRESTEQERQQLLAARQAAQAQEAQREAAWLAQPQQVYVDTSRPWSANSTTYYISREQEVCAGWAGLRGPLLGGGNWVGSPQAAESGV